MHRDRVDFGGGVEVQTAGESRLRHSRTGSPRNRKQRDFGIDPNGAHSIILLGTLESLPFY